MSTQVRKVCLLGDFGVGKTSLVQRFVHSSFSEKYLTTVGVKIDTKEVLLDGIGRVKLVVWDIAGTDQLKPLFQRYLQGAAGYLLVADGTRADTLDNAMDLRAHVESQLGSLPFVGLINKCDLSDQWEIPPNRLQGADGLWLETSALSGANVEQAFLDLARRVVS
jgi:small GTP-binding protein